MMDDLPKEVSFDVEMTSAEATVVMEAEYGRHVVLQQRGYQRGVVVYAAFYGAALSPIPCSAAIH